MGKVKIKKDGQVVKPRIATGGGLLGKVVRNDTPAPQTGFKPVSSGLIDRGANFIRETMQEARTAANNVQRAKRAAAQEEERRRKNREANARLDYRNYDNELQGYLGPETTVIGTKGKKSSGKPSLKNTPAITKPKATSHTIQKGETLGSIAKKYGVDWKSLAEANGIDNPNLIYAGKKLKIDPATMGKRNKRKVGVNKPRVEPPGMHANERTFRTPTRTEATATNLPMGTGAINIDLPEDYY